MVENDEDVGDVETVKPVETAEPKTDKTDAVKTETSAPVQTPEPSAPAQTSAPAQSVQPTVKPTTEPSVPATTPAPTTDPTPTPKPVHEHSWKEHVATTQVWVSNIVVVDYYEDHVVTTVVARCACGFETTDKDVISNHVKESIRANDGQAHNFSTQEHTHTEQIRVGSHEEDQGTMKPTAM